MATKMTAEYEDGIVYIYVRRDFSRSEQARIDLTGIVVVPTSIDRALVANGYERISDWTDGARGGWDAEIRLA